MSQSDSKIIGMWRAAGGVVTTHHASMPTAKLLPFLRQLMDAQAGDIYQQRTAIIQRALRDAGGNVSKAAKSVGCHRNTIYRHMKGGLTQCDMHEDESW